MESIDLRLITTNLSNRTSIFYLCILYLHRSCVRCGTANVYCMFHSPKAASSVIRPRRQYAARQLPVQPGTEHDPTLTQPPRYLSSLLIMPHSILYIDELLRPIIDELMETSQQTVLSLALTCWSLEEPALSSLWKEQPSLTNLIKVLPSYTSVRTPSWGWAGIETKIDVSGHNFLTDRT